MGWTDRKKGCVVALILLSISASIYHSIRNDGHVLLQYEFLIFII